MNFFKPNTLNVIILIPVAIAMSQNGGCASTPEPGPMTKDQVVATISGNTIKLTAEESYALVGSDGSLKGLNIPSGGTTGSWRVSDNDVLCARWDNVGSSQENCDVMRYKGDKEFQWGGSTLQILKGNPKNL
jgi:hypothetical protein